MSKITGIPAAIFKAVPTPVKHLGTVATGVLTAASLFGTGSTKALAKDLAMLPVETTAKVVNVAAKPVVDLAQDVFESTVK
jgi:hypothetical protein